MKKKMDFLPNKMNKYSIRRFTVGTASILVGATLVFGIGNNEAHAAEKTSTEESTQSNDDTSSQDSVKQKGDVQTSEQATNNNDIPQQVDVTNEASTSEETATKEAPKADTTKEESTTKEAPKADTTKEEPATKEAPKADTTKEAPKADTTKEEPATKEAPKADTTKETPSTSDQTPESKQTDSTETTSEQAPQPVTQSQNSPKSNTKQDVDTVVNDVQNASTTQDKQEALTNYIADTNNTSKEDAKAQVENLDLDYNNLDENTLLGALAKDYSNKKDSETTYATTRSTEATPKPVNRLAVRKLAAEATGKNVDNLITVTKQSINEGQSNDGEIKAHEAENIEYESEFKIDNAVKQGDTMTVSYDPRTTPSDLTSDHEPVDITDPSGEIIAKGTYDEATKKITYTFTSYVDKYENINAKLLMNSYIDKKEVPNKENINLTFGTGNATTSKSVYVDYQDPVVRDNSNIQSIFTNLDTANNKVEQTIYVNPLRNQANHTNVTIASGEVADDGTISAGDGSTIIDDDTEIKVYKVGPNQELPESNRIYDYSQYEDVTDSLLINKNAGANQANINFGNIDSAYIVKVVSKYTPTDSYGDLKVE